MKKFVLFNFLILVLSTFFFLIPQNIFAQTCPATYLNRQGPCPPDKFCSKVGPPNCNLRDSNCKSECTLKPILGGSCLTAVGCRDDSYCNKDTKKCTTRLAPGGSCEINGTNDLQGNCANNLFCTLVDPGCNVRSGNCRRECRDRQTEGGGCTRAPGDPKGSCADGNYCDLGGAKCSNDGKCTGGTCKKVPAENEQCIKRGNSYDKVAGTCGNNLICDTSGDKSSECKDKNNCTGTCRTKPAEGGECRKFPFGTQQEQTQGTCNEGLECQVDSCDRAARECKGKCVKPGINADEKIPTPPEAPCAPGKKIDGKCTEFESAFGNFATDPGEFLRTVFGILLAASGAIALLLIMRAGYKIMTSQGKPETIQEGRDQLIAAIVGLLFLVFSFVFLQLIGVDILQIPGISGTSGTLDKGAPCDVAGNTFCKGGLTCVSNGGRSGTCQ